MNLIIWLIVGGVVGWLASLIMRTDAQQGIVLNVVVGIVGAFLAGLVVAKSEYRTQAVAEVLPLRLLLLASWIRQA